MAWAPMTGRLSALWRAILHLMLWWSASSALSPTATALVAFDPPRPVSSTAATDTAGDFAPRLATDGRRNWVAVWLSRGEPGEADGDDIEVYVARSSDDAVTWSSAAVLNGDAVTDSDDASTLCLATDRRGRWMVAWGSGSFPRTEILYSQSLDNGLTWSAPQTMAVPFTPEFGGFLGDLEAGGPGVWVAILIANGSSAPSGRRDRVLVMRSHDQGMSWSSRQVAVGFETDSPTLTTDGDGRWVAAWESDSEARVLPVPFGINVATSYDDGLTWSAPELIRRGDPVFEQDYGPSAATDQHGNWVVTFMRYGAGQQQLFSTSSRSSQTTAAAGNTRTVWSRWSTPSRIDPNSALEDGEDDFPMIAGGGARQFVAVWSSSRTLGGSIGDDRDILFSETTDAAASWSAPRPLNTNAGMDRGADGGPEIATDRSGRWIAVWDSTDDLGGTIGSDADILYAGGSETRVDPPPAAGDRSGIMELCPNGVCGLWLLPPRWRDWCWTNFQRFVPPGTRCDPHCLFPSPPCCGNRLDEAPSGRDVGLTLAAAGGRVIVADGVMIRSVGQGQCERCRKGRKLREGDVLELQAGAALQVQTAKGVLSTPKGGLPILPGEPKNWLVRITNPPR